MPGHPMSQSKPVSTATSDLIPAECWLEIADLQKPAVVDHIADEEQRKKTVKNMLHNLIKKKSKL